MKTSRCIAATLLFLTHCFSQAAAASAAAPAIDSARDTISPAYDWATTPYAWAEIRDGKLPITPVHWERSGSKPMVAQGMNSRPIVWDEQTVRMFYARRGPGHGIYYFDVDPSTPDKIKHGPVGPIITTGPSGAYDEEWVLAPEPVRLSETHQRMYYSAKRKGAFFGKVWSLAVADSYDNGATWTKFAGNPILTVSDRPWESSGVGFCSVEKNELGWRMWYLGSEGDGLGVIKQVGYASSDDGLAWKRHADNPVLRVDPTNRWEAGAVAVPRVIHDSRILKVWYACYEKNDSYAVACAESFDGIQWFRNPHNPVLLGSGQGWDSGMVTYPGVVRVGNRYLMWYSGNGYGNAGIGLATANPPQGSRYYRVGKTARPDAEWSVWATLGDEEPKREGYIQFAVAK